MVDCNERMRWEEKYCAKFDHLDRNSIALGKSKSKIEREIVNERAKRKPKKRQFFFSLAFSTLKSEIKTKNNKINMKEQKMQSNCCGRSERSNCIMFALLIFILTAFVTVADGGRVPSRVDVNKCCRLGEILDKNQQCAIGDTDHWWPLIFVIARKTYFEPKGDAPRFLHANESRMPGCDKPEPFENMALFTNGSLFLLEKSAFIEPDNFCIDKDIALVCFPRPQGVDSLRAPKKLTKIQKCCPIGFVYSTIENNCVSVNEEHSRMTEKVIENETSIEFLYRFPKCDSNSHAIAERFDESKLNLETGSLLRASEQRTEWNKYCLEHIVSADEPVVKVLTCSEHLIVPAADKHSRQHRVSQSFWCFWTLSSEKWTRT